MSFIQHRGLALLFLLIIAGLSLFAARLVRKVRLEMTDALNMNAEMLEWRVFLKDDQDSTPVVQAIKQVPGVMDVKLITKTEALNEAMKDIVLSKNLELLESNPFPASLKVSWNSGVISHDKFLETEDAVTHMPQVREVAYNRDLVAWIDQTRNWIGRLNSILAVIIAILSGIVAGTVSLLFGFFGMAARSARNYLVLAAVIVAFADIYAGAEMPDAGPKYVQKQLDAETQNLKRVKRRIEEKEKQVKEVKQKEEKVKSEIYRLDESIQQVQTSLKDTDIKLQTVKKDIKTNESVLTGINDDKQKRAGALTDGYYSYYVAWSAQAIGQENRAVAGYALDAAGLELRRVSAKSLGLEVKLQKLSDSKRDAEKSKTNYQIFLKKANNSLAKKQTVYSDTVSHRAAAEKELKELYRAASKLKQLITDLERKRVATPEQQARTKYINEHLSEKMGKLKWPLEGAIAGQFGHTKHPEFGTPIISNGISIKARPGTSVGAVDQGEVIYVGSFMSYGNMVLIDHSGWACSVYAHLAAIDVKEGQKVVAGDTIGASGYINDNVPGLYFELRVDNEPVDPLLWLKR